MHGSDSAAIGSSIISGQFSSADLINVEVEMSSEKKLSSKRMSFDIRICLVF